MEFSFERLEVWKDSKALVKSIYILTLEFPSEEKFGMVSQIRRASISVTNNIAEGTSRVTFKEKARFIEISYASLMEVLNCIIISSELSFLNNEQYESLRKEIHKIANKLNALSRHYKSRG